LPRRTATTSAKIEIAISSRVGAEIDAARGGFVDRPRKAFDPAIGFGKSGSIRPKERANADACRRQR
jgi:hypothetical protein